MKHYILIKNQQSNFKDSTHLRISYRIRIFPIILLSVDLAPLI